MLKYFLAAAAIAASAPADVRLPTFFSDNMVLQRSADARIWGWATPGDKVRVAVEPGIGSAECVAGLNGAWIATIKTPDDSPGPLTVTVSSGTTVTIRNVVLGDIWLCSGQSNMEMTVAQSDGGADDVARSADDGIRLLMIPNRISASPMIDADARWVVCGPSTVAEFSAVGYHFATAVRSRTGARIGLISADWGGTPIEAWCDAPTLGQFDFAGPGLDRVSALADPSRRQSVLVGTVEKWWSALDGPDGVSGWAGPGFDDRDWTAGPVPAPWTGDLGAFDGVVRMRRSLDLPADWDGRPGTLYLGPIDDQDDAWINGTRVGSTYGGGRWLERRAYAVPAGLLRSGSNIIGVRMLDTAGTGGANGAPADLRLERDGASVPLAGEWKFRRGRSIGDLPRLPDASALSAGSPTSLFNGMVAPLRGMSIRGVLWYQGESNRGNYAQYARLFPAMITGWRSVFGSPELPFYFVQIAPFNYGGDPSLTPLLREAQTKGLALPRTGMAVTLDIGDPADIHPRNKREVGRRLALMALADVYASPGIVSRGPSLKDFVVRGASVRITLDGAAGLRGSGKSLDGFEIAGSDRKFVPADVSLDDGALVVSSPNVPAPAAVRYGWSDSPPSSVVNGAGLPLAPFRTDSW